MKIEQRKFTACKGWETLPHRSSFDAALCNLVIAFGNAEIIGNTAWYENIQAGYPKADLLLTSTSGEIYDTEVNDHSVSLIAVQFDKTKTKTAVAGIHGVKNSFEAGRVLAAELNLPGLTNVFVISDGLQVNGSDLVLGLQDFLPKGITITGGLAGDDAKFKSTLVGLNELPVEGRIAAIGFYGDNLSVNYGSVGGWDPFGPERLITRSQDNILFELDYQPALEVYKKYLGEYADELPGSGLLFPLSIREDDGNDAIVRTILGVNEDNKSLTFAGNMPQGNYARLMKANFDRLIEGAYDAAHKSIHAGVKEPDLAILISCVGRKLVLNHRIEEEVEEIRQVYGKNTALTGFYSYGEISPSNTRNGELHNQTMTITTFTEE